MTSLLILTSLNYKRLDRKASSYTQVSALHLFYNMKMLFLIPVWLHYCNRWNATFLWYKGEIDTTVLEKFHSGTLPMFVHTFPTTNNPIMNRKTNVTILGRLLKHNQINSKCWFETPQKSVITLNAVCHRYMLSQ